MVRGIRKGSTVLSPQVQPTAYYQYDFVTRRAVRVVETIVPTIHAPDDNATNLIPADRYYANVGAATATTELPIWVNNTNNVTHGNWDSSQEAFYARLDLTGFIRGDLARLFYYSGVAGAGSEYAPKNVDVTKLILQFTARFSGNVDWTVHGVGLIGPLDSEFDDSAKHFIQVTRNAGNWELGSCDGSTISQSSGGSADGSFHAFKVEWTSSGLTLYVDGTSTITKSTNLPEEPLLPLFRNNSGENLDIVDMLVTWE